MKSNEIIEKILKAVDEYRIIVGINDMKEKAQIKCNNMRLGGIVDGLCYARVLTHVGYAKKGLTKVITKGERFDEFIREIKAREAEIIEL
jgi:hypothetical protein